MSSRASTGLIAVLVLIVLGLPTSSYAADCAKAIENIDDERHDAIHDMDKEVSKLANKLDETTNANEANQEHQKSVREIRDTASQAIEESSEEASECPNNQAVQAALATAVAEISAAEKDAHRAANQLLAEWHATNAPPTTTTTTSAPPTLPPTTMPPPTLPPVSTTQSSTTTTITPGTTTSTTVPTASTTSTSSTTTSTTTVAGSTSPGPPASDGSTGDTPPATESPDQFPTTGFIEVDSLPPLTADTGSIAGNIGIALRTVLPTNVTIAVLSPLVVAEMLLRAMTAAGAQVFLPSILLTMFLGAVLRRRDKKALLELT